MTRVSEDTDLAGLDYGPTCEAHCGCPNEAVWVVRFVSHGCRYRGQARLACDEHVRTRVCRICGGPLVVADVMPVGAS